MKNKIQEEDPEAWIMQNEQDNKKTASVEEDNSNKILFSFSILLAWLKNIIFVKK